MTTCLWCNQRIISQLTLSDLILFKPIKKKLVCDNCYIKFEPININESCPVCSKVQLTKEICTDCLKWKKKYTNIEWRHHALFRYNDYAKEWISRYKFTGDIRIADMLVDDLVKKVGTIKKVDFVVPIPVSKESFTQRGFNQVEILLKKANIRYFPILENESSTERQSKKNRQQRLETNQPFELSKINVNLVDKNILIVDDVYTTGRTILHAVNCLDNAGVRKIETLSLFR